MIDLSSLPSDPGCYLFHDPEGNVIYVGKAKNLKRRVSSYFNRHDRDPKTGRLVETASSVNFIATTNEVEALILENTLIKRYQPKFNIDLKDSKNYAYILLTSEEFPCLRIARRTGEDGTYFGPFVSATERDYVFSVVKKTFRLRTCRKLPKRGCLRRHMDSCSAPCRDGVSREEYRDQVRKASLVLRGKSEELRSALTAEMVQRAEEHAFEQALILREQVRAVAHLSRHQDMARPKKTDEDIVNYRVHEQKVYLMLFSVYKGTLADKMEWTFPESEEFLEEFIIQHYSVSEPPADLVLPEEVDESVAEFLSRMKGRKVTVTVPKMGAKKRLLDLVQKNIELSFFGDRVRIIELQEHLRLQDPPEVIECFDISHLSGTALVGSMVRFRGGKPDKRNYRRFRIKTVDGIDDTGAIAEVVRRRYSRLASAGDPFPDLVIVDGGRGQLSAAQKELELLGLHIPVAALAKRHEEVFVPGQSNPLPLSPKENASLYLQEIRDEAHRFAVAYNRLLRRKTVIP